MDPRQKELELTPDLLEYAKAVALKEAQKRCPRYVDFDDVIQFAMLQLIRRPPKFDPSRGASPKTLIYTIVHRAVIKYAKIEAKQACRFRQSPESVGASRDGERNEPADHRISERRTAELSRSGWSMDDILQFIDNEDSRALCRLVIECGGNLSEAARRLGLSEGTVRYRLKLLGPKLLAAGFDPFLTGDMT
jgi:RNA polymerase sigma factor (sigma-70 family)